MSFVVLDKIKWNQETIIDVFGESNFKIAQEITSIIKGDGYSQAYYMMFDVLLNGKFTQIYTNRVKGCPIFFPKSVLNSGRFKNVELSENAKKAIDEISKDLIQDESQFE